jgi:hypothetical protein
MSWLRWLGRIFYWLGPTGVRLAQGMTDFGFLLAQESGCGARKNQAFYWLGQSGHAFYWLGLTGNGGVGFLLALRLGVVFTAMPLFTGGPRNSSEGLHRVKWLISKGLIGFGYLFGTFPLQIISKILDSLWIRDQVNRAWAHFQRLSRILDMIWSGNVPNKYPNPIKPLDISHFTL